MADHNVVFAENLLDHWLDDTFPVPAASITAHFLGNGDEWLIARKVRENAEAAGNACDEIQRSAERLVVRVAAVAAVIILGKAVDDPLVIRDLLRLDQAEKIGRRIAAVAEGAVRFINLRVAFANLFRNTAAHYTTAVDLMKEKHRF